MRNDELAHIEGVAALEHQHHKTSHRCLCLLWIILAAVITGFAVGLWPDQTEAELRQIIVKQQETIMLQTATINRLKTDSPDS